MECCDFVGLMWVFGLDDVLCLDYSVGELKVGDWLLLISDGVYGVLCVC